MLPPKELDLGYTPDGVECVLELMAEGGSLTLLAKSGESPQFAVWLQDQCLEMVEEGSALNTQSEWGTFTEALARLDRYPWRKLYPRYIAPAFLDRILDEVTCHGPPLSPQTLERWDDAATACLAGEQRKPRAPR